MTQRDGGVIDDIDLVAEWTSSDPAIATVDDRGEVRGIAPGEVTITANVDDNSLVPNDLTATARLRVVP